MAIETDVLVIGGGLAGRVTALAAAETGASVRLISHKESTLRQASGLIDVLGYAPTVAGPLTDPFSALDELPAGHPYRIIGEAAIRSGLALFDDVAGRYGGDHTDQNALVPTAGGTVKPTARYPPSVTPGLASDRRATLLVGFETLPGFDAPLAAAHLETAGVPFAVRGVTVRFPRDLRTDATATHYAVALDDDSELRRALVRAIDPHLNEAERVGVPAILGRRETAEVTADLAEHLGLPIFEIPTGPPSLPGIRLAAILDDALGETGVHVTTGNPVVDYSADGDRIQSVTIDRNGARVPVVADQFVLATGGLVGKGLDSDREEVREPLFRCHVPHPSDRTDWYADDPFGDHPFARFGVRIDDRARVLNATDQPSFTNLRAAGAVVGGADVAAEKSASGVSLATGYVAGTEAGAA